ncbi:twitch domain-containing radical SAM protein [Bdellovibrio sp. HCB2-146]|uniref:twitch domain-containing radical SAM protein n=1 Tax=Bdellovibrio sp. HCB2-146 TaxID=3394362 RepID=UPI0039BC3266
MKTNGKENFICPFPWLTPCVTTSGHFRVCPVSQSSPSKGLIKSKNSYLHIETPNAVNEWRNSETLMQLRDAMMNGKDISSSCYRCLQEEENGIHSRRQMELARHPNFTHEFVASVTSENGTIASETPIESLVIRLGNKCNLACRMCGPTSSSAWYKEWKQHESERFQDDFEKVVLQENSHGQVTPIKDIYKWAEQDLLLKFIQSCGNKLHRIHFSGGEPLLVESHIPLLEKLVESKQAPHIGLDYNSNLTVVPEQILKLWASFHDVQIGASLDGPPEINDYIRYPSKTAPILRNIERIGKAVPRAKIWISTTVQIYNIFYLQEMAAWVRTLDLPGLEKNFSWHILRGPAELSIYALPQPIKQKLVALYTGTEFSAVAESLQQVSHADMFEKFKKYTHRLDLGRNQKIQNLSVLYSEIKNYWES